MTLTNSFDETLSILELKITNTFYYNNQKKIIQLYKRTKYIYVLDKKISTMCFYINIIINNILY